MGPTYHWLCDFFPTADFPLFYPFLSRQTVMVDWDYLTMDLLFSADAPFFFFFSNSRFSYFSSLLP